MKYHLRIINQKEEFPVFKEGTLYVYINTAGLLVYRLQGKAQTKFNQYELGKEVLENILNALKEGEELDKDSYKKLLSVLKEKNYEIIQPKEENIKKNHYSDASDSEEEESPKKRNDIKILAGLTTQSVFNKFDEEEREDLFKNCAEKFISWTAEEFQDNLKELTADEKFDEFSKVLLEIKINKGNKSDAAAFAFFSLGEYFCDKSKKEKKSEESEYAIQFLLRSLEFYPEDKDYNGKFLELLKKCPYLLDNYHKKVKKVWQNSSGKFQSEFEELLTGKISHLIQKGKYVTAQEELKKMYGEDSESKIFKKLSKECKSGIESNQFTLILKKAETTKNGYINLTEKEVKVTIDLNEPNTVEDVFEQLKYEDLKKEVKKYLKNVEKEKIQETLFSKLKEIQKGYFMLDGKSLRDNNFIEITAEYQTACALKKDGNFPEAEKRYAELLKKSENWPKTDYYNEKKINCKTLKKECKEEIEKLQVLSMYQEALKAKEEGKFSTSEKICSDALEKIGSWPDAKNYKKEMKDYSFLQKECQEITQKREIKLTVRNIELDEFIKTKEMTIDLTWPTTMQDVLTQIGEKNLGFEEGDLEKFLEVEEGDYSLLYQAAAQYEGAFFKNLQEKFDNSVCYDKKLYSTDGIELPEKFRPVNVSIELDKNFSWKNVEFSKIKEDYNYLYTNKQNNEIKLDFSYLLQEGIKKEEIKSEKSINISFQWNKIQQQTMGDLEKILKEQYAKLLKCDQTLIQFDWKKMGLSKESSFQDGLNTIKQKGIKFLTQEAFKIQFSISEYGKEDNKEEITKVKSKKYVLDLNLPNTVGDVLKNLDHFPHDFKKEDFEKPAISFKEQFEKYTKQLSKEQAVLCGERVSKKTIDKINNSAQTNIMHMRNYELIFGYSQANFTLIPHINNDEVSYGLRISFEKEGDAEKFNENFKPFFKLTFDNDTKSYVLNLQTIGQVKWDVWD